MISRTKKNQEKIKEIEHEKKKERRDYMISIIIKIVVVLIIIFLVLYIALRYIGNMGIVVKETVVTSDKIPDSFNGLKIVQFSDLHYGTSVDKEKLNQLVEQINKIKPDILVFTGDLLDNYNKVSDDEISIVKEALKKMDAKLGKYAVQGNHDKKNFNSLMSDTDFKILQNEYELIYSDGYNPILLIGLGSRNLKKRDIDRAYQYFELENSNEDIFTILLLHEPDDIDKILDKYPTDLALAGHSHNGQIRLPFVKALLKVNGAKKYYEEYYRLGETDLYVSGGVGCSHYPFRLFNHPSINFIRIRKK